MRPLVAFLAASLGAATASAEEPPVIPRDLGPSAVHSRLGVEETASRLAVRGETVRSLSSSPVGEWAFLDSVSLRARVPFHVLDAGGQTRAGPGDTELRIRWRALASPPFQGSVGLALTLPTGSNSRGLGGGNVKLLTYATAGRQIGDAVLFVALADSVAFGTAPAPDLTDPDSDHEIRYDLGAIYSIARWISPGLVINGITVLERQNRGDTLVAASPQLVVVPATNLRVTLLGSLPVAGPRRFDERVTLSAYYIF